MENWRRPCDFFVHKNWTQNLFTNQKLIFPYELNAAPGVKGEE